MRSARSLAIILIVHLAVIVLWQVLVDAFHVPKFVQPSPLATVATLTSAKYAWLSNLAVTAVEILGGFALGAFVGVALAVLFCWSPLLSLLLLPLFVTLNMIPKVAVAGAIVGEFIASERGLGYLMIQVQSSLDTPAMVMAVVLLTLLGVALYGLVLGLERLFVVRDIRLQ